MVEEFSLASELNNFWRPHLARFGMSVRIIDDDRAFFIGNGFTIGFFLDRDGLGVWYFSLKNVGAPHWYDLKELVYGFRLKQNEFPERRAFSSWEDKQRFDLHVVSQLLIEKCGDVLSGDKAWIKEYEVRRGSQVASPGMQDAYREIFDQARPD